MPSPRAVIGYVMLALVALSPLTFGAVAPWAWTTLAFAIGVIGFLFAIAMVSRGRAIDAGALIIPTLFCLIAFVWGWCQLANVPPDWIHPISDVGRNILSDTHAAITLNPDGTLQTLLRWVMYAVTFFVAFVWAQDAERARRGLNILVVVGTLYAAYGLIVIFMGSDMAMWVHKPMYQTAVTGPFINKNNFASYLGAILCIALGLLLRRIMRDTASTRGAEFWRELLASCMHRGAWLVIAVVILFSALLLAQSRAGLASFGVAFAVLMALMRLAGIFRGKVFYWGASVLTIILIALFFLSGSGVFDRLVSEGEPARPQLYELEITAMMDRPWLGHGLGSFPQIFQIYRTDDMPPGFFTERGHSVYLENLLELGIPAALCLFIGIGWLLCRTVACVGNGARHRTIPAVCAAAMMMLCVHGLIDFPLQIPAITLLFVWLLGTGAARIKN